MCTLKNISSFCNEKYLLIRHSHECKVHVTPIPIVWNQSQKFSKFVYIGLIIQYKNKLIASDYVER